MVDREWLRLVHDLWSVLWVSFIALRRLIRWQEEHLAQATLCYWEPSSTKRGTAPPIFGPCLLWPNSWMHQDTTWYGGRSWPRPHCVRWSPSSPHGKGTAAPLFGPCLLWPNSSPSQLLLSSCPWFWPVLWVPFIALRLLVRWQEGHLACKRPLPLISSVNACFPTQDQQLGTHYLLLYEQFNRLQLSGSVWRLIFCHWLLILCINIV